MFISKLYATFSIHLYQNLNFNPMQNPQQILIETQFEGLILYVRPHETHEWLMETKLVAEGYGVSEEVIRNHKSRNARDFEEDKHFISVTNCYANPRGGIAHIQTFWTKRGVIRLGFFIKSERARLFRDWAEDLIIRELEKKEEYVTKQELKKFELRIHQYLDALNTKINKKHTLIEELIHNLSGRVDKLERTLYQPYEIEERHAYVYIMRKEGTNEFKIGKSIDPNFRQRRLEDGGSNLELVSSKLFPSENLALTWENLLKRLFQKKQIRGEWFLLSRQDIQTAKELFKFLEGIY